MRRIVDLSVGKAGPSIDDIDIGQNSQARSLNSEHGTASGLATNRKVSTIHATVMGWTLSAVTAEIVVEIANNYAWTNH